MARQSGLIKIKGSIDGVSFYGKNGEKARRNGGADKERIMTDPAFKRLRENMSEFGGAAKVASAMKVGFSNVQPLMGRRFTSRAVKVMRQLVAPGAGSVGQRAFEILNHGHMLQDFEFTPVTPFRSVFRAPMQAPVLDANRSIATWTVDEFTIENYITAPRKASHFQLVLSATVLSDFTYDEERHLYLPVNRDLNETNALALGELISLKEDTSGGNIALVADLGLADPLPDTAAVLVAIGIVFFKESYGKHLTLSSGDAMRIETVG